MNYLIGNAIEIFCEVPTDKVSGTTLTLLSLKDQTGTEYASGQSLTFDLTILNRASFVWQSVKGTHDLGRYSYIVKSLNGTIENYSRGTFYLMER